MKDCNLYGSFCFMSESLRRCLNVLGGQVYVGFVFPFGPKFSHSFLTFCFVTSVSAFLMRHCRHRLVCSRSLFSLPLVSYAKTGLPPLLSPLAMDLHLNKVTVCFFVCFFFFFFFFSFSLSSIIKHTSTTLTSWS
jgi:hypothetical protein